jgi:hypothetical protein
MSVCVIRIPYVCMYHISIAIAPRSFFSRSYLNFMSLVVGHELVVIAGIAVPPAVCVYVYMDIWAYGYMCICVYVYMCICVYVYMGIWVYV